MLRILSFGLSAAFFALPVSRALADQPRVLHLDQAVSTGLERQPAVREARALSEAATGRVAEARSGYLPQVTGSALYERVHGSASTRPNTVGATVAPLATTRAATYDIFSFGVSATQLIWDFGQTIDRTRAASASLDAERSAERTARLSVVLQVRQAFFRARAEKALVRVGKETVDNQERHLKQIEGFVTQGIRPDIDLAQARTDLANAKVTLITATSGYGTAKAQLNQAMGVVSTTSYDVADDDLAEVPGENGSPEALLRDAISARPELATLKRQQRAAELTVSSLRGAYGPTLSALGGVSEAGPSLDTLGTNWNVGVNLTWPLFQGGLTNGQVREASSNADVASAQVTTEELNVRVQVEQSWLSVQAQKVAILAAHEAADNARIRLRLAEGRYESGVGSIIELADAELAVANAGAQLVQAEYALAAARADLLSALGK